MSRGSWNDEPVVQVVMSGTMKRLFAEWVAEFPNVEIYPIPNGTDDEGNPILDNPSDLPTYSFGVRP